MLHRSILNVMLVGNRKCCGRWFGIAVARARSAKLTSGCASACGSWPRSDAAGDTAGLHALPEREGCVVNSKCVYRIQVKEKLVERRRRICA